MSAPDLDAQGAPLPSPKGDPEAFALRGRPERPIRFKKKLIIGLSAITAAMVAGMAWVALGPRLIQPEPQAVDYPLPAKAPNDTLSALPTSYGDAPKLGPPLPGDLGRAILDQQRELSHTPTVETGAIPPPVTSPTDHAEDDLRAARQSQILFQANDRAASSVDPMLTGGASRQQASETNSAAPVDPERDPNAQAHKAQFLNTADKGSDQNSFAIVPPASPYMLSAGSVITASLITGLRSDIPGLVTAQVTERVFDSATGEIELIPQGARLIGTYDSVVAFGQRRALVIWQRIIMPNGSSLKIDNVAATDAGGYAGLADRVDFHTWTLLEGVGISTLLGVGSSLGLSGGSDLVSAIRQAAQQNVSRAGDQLTSRNLQVQPTITVRPGTPVRLVVHHDLILEPWHD